MWVQDGNCQRLKTMASRPVIIASLLGASVGVPYVVSNMPKTSTEGTWPFAAKSAPNASQLKSPEQLRLPIASPGSQLYASPAPLEGSPALAIEQVFRFDLTREWVYRSWARKSTGVPYNELFGVRVPLVTGKSVADLAGSLTYFFDAQGQLQHISFHGRTGDTSRLVDFLVRNYKFHRATAAAGMPC